MNHGELAGVSRMSMGMRAFGQQYQDECDGRKARLDIARVFVSRDSPRWPDSAVVAEIIERRNDHQQGGSARKPTISRGAHERAKAVPISIAASDRKTRAVANSPRARWRFAPRS